MIAVFAVLGLAVVVVIALVVLGRETARLAVAARPAVFDMTEAVAFIADRLPADVQGRISHDDVRWILLADADLVEEASDDAPAAGVGGDAGGEALALDPVGQEVVPVPGAAHLLDADDAVARVLGRADESGRELLDEDVVAVLDARMAYLQAIGAVGPEADGPGSPSSPTLA